MPYVQTATTVDRTGQLEVQKLLHIDTNTFRGRRAWQKYLYAADCLLVSRIEAKEKKRLLFRVRGTFVVAPMETNC